MKFLVLITAALLSIPATLLAEIDPYAEEVSIQEGPNKGKVADTSSRRSIVILPEAEAAKYGAQSGAGDTVIANFYHEGKFWIAHIPADGVEDMIFQVWKFNKLPPISHDQLRFIMKEGKEITLYPQVSGDTAPPEKVKDLVFSMEAIGPKETKFGIRNGLNGSFMAAYRFKSQKEDYFERVMSAKLVVRQMRTSFNEKQMQDAFRRSLQLSHDSAHKVMYHLTRKSCTTVAYQIIDAVAGYNLLQTMFTAVNWLPNWPEWHLYWRGLEPERLATVNDELKDMAKDRGLRRRLLSLLSESKEERNQLRQERREAETKKSTIRRCFERLAGR